MEINEILTTEFCPNFANRVRKGVRLEGVDKFVELCENAMVMSYHKYGRVVDGFGPGKSCFAVESAFHRLEMYDRGGKCKDVVHKPGNREWLTDVFNFCMIEAMHPRTRFKNTRKTFSLNPKKRLRQIHDHLEEYQQDGCFGRLIAAARLALVEFLDPQHPGAHFAGTDRGCPGRETVEGLSERRNITSRVAEFR